MKFIDKNERHLNFTEKEIAVTWFFMTGMNAKKISEWSGIPEKSISYYKRRVMKKIGAENNNEFIMWFLDNRSNYLKEENERSILMRHCNT